MKNYYVIFILVLMSKASFCQNFPKWEGEIRNENYIPKGRDTASVIKINDSLFQLTTDFNNYINIKCIVKVYNACDTVWIPDSLGIDIPHSICYNYTIPNGLFTSYHVYSLQKQEEGLLFGGKRKKGDWKKWDIKGNLIETSSYNNNGEQVGDYFEYYSNGQIKWKGQYKIEKINIYNNLNTVTEDKGVKSGYWYHYDEKGILLETVTYKWNYKQH